MYWYEIKNISEIDSPALILYKERVAENIAQAKEMVQHVSLLRPHVKTNKIAEVCSMMMEQGFTKFKCATIAEAEMLGRLYAPDVLLAYQPNGPKIKRLLQLVQQYPDTSFSCLTDDADNAKAIADIFMDAGRSLNVFIDVNTGMNRTGIQSQNAINLIEYIQTLPALHIKGLHGYDGHIRDVAKNERKEKSDGAFEKLVHIKNTFPGSITKDWALVAGGSTTFDIHAGRENIECSPGTFVFWDWGYKNLFPQLPFEYAAVVISRIISIVDSETICTDLGHKSVAAENPMPRVYFINAPEIIPVAQSEEHLIAKVPDASKYKTGDVLYGVPVHICPTVALYENAMVAENNFVATSWKVIARDRSIGI